ncbi:MAG: zinc ABC transporter substrate-binding protein [Thermoplasmata archaeon]|nr:zinc ABC transporter substrate-binding protein [Thermoplasmata archaeon]
MAGTTTDTGHPIAPVPGSPHASLGTRSPSHKSSRAAPIALVVLLLLAGTLVAIHLSAKPVPLGTSCGGIQVVAAENFWGSLIGQLGGTRVCVVSIVSDPNADPHEYETSTVDAVAIANAHLVIENGAGYDDWCLHLVSASNSPHQIVLNIATLLGKVSGDNPHFWYGAAYVNASLAAMFGDLVAIDGTDRAYFQSQYALLNASLTQEVLLRENEIRAQYVGTAVASTESIFVYLANSTGLDLVSPPAFMNAVSEGNDPPIASVTEFENQLQSGNVSLLVYNEQTLTPLTEQMKNLSVQHHIPVVGVTETILPSGTSFEVWMGGQLLALQNALAQRAP